MQVSQLLPLRLLRCSTSLFHPSLPTLRRAFPFKPEYSTLSSTSCTFSYRTGGMHVRAASSGKGARSLIDDEAELSDWVGDLKESNIIRSGLDRGKENSDRRGGGGRVRDRDFGMDMRGRGERTGMLNSGEVSSKRRREGGFGSRVNPSKKISSKLLLDSDEDEEEDRRPRGGTRGSQMRSSRRRDLDMGRFSSPIAKTGERRTSEMGFRKRVDDQRKPLVRMSKENNGRRTSAFEVSEEDDDDDDESDEDEFGSDDDEFGCDDDVKGSSIEPAVGIQGMIKSTSSEGNNASSYLSQTRFDQCSVSPLSLKAIKAAGYERLTLVQEATLPVILKGKDVLAKAKTGTGKTIGFLLPAIEIVLKQTPVDRDNRRPPIYVLIICPTRELANQAAMEAATLLKFHPNIGVQFVTGGTRLALEQKRLQANPCQILVATPGRLRDHTENTAGFATRLMGVKVLVLDEADHLLDMGFRKDIEKIIAAVPKQRQTLLFSATVPEEVRQVCHIALRRDHEFINTVAEGSEETHSQVAQMLMVAPLDKHFSLLYHILEEHIRDDADYKVLVFCTTAMVTRLVAGILSELKLNVREIHSRKPQSYRTRVSDEFRKSKGLILVTSDVSARGVDYPDVTLVMQIGVPSDREQYIHRLGRTGRKGKEGQGILLLAPWEDYFTSTVKDLPISKASLPHIDSETVKKVDRALAHVEMKSKEAAYQAWLGYYNSNKRVARDKNVLVQLANEFSRSMGLDSPPAISKQVLGKMGLRNVAGLRSK